ncbi:hypothetical protein NCTGTJJY_CDS0202 [Serratia phage 92A1]|nr:hypothetical protein NCTGTJJY_CDS0202 [Serratia phage 92A1]
MNKAVEVHFLYESGTSFDEIARSLGISPKEAAQLYVSAKVAEDKYKNKEPVVYRKRLIVKQKPQKRRQKTEPAKRSMTNEQLNAFMQAAKEKGWA